MKTLVKTAVVPLVVLALAGYGAATDPPAGGTSPVKSTSTTADEAKFTTCMRENGANISDASAGNDRTAGVGTVGVPDAREKKALERCHQYLPQGEELPAPKPEDMRKMREYATCMRQNGVPDFPDPDSPRSTVVKDGDALSDLDGQAFSKALKACEKLAAGLPEPIGIGG